MRNPAPGQRTLTLICAGALALAAAGGLAFMKGVDGTLASSYGKALVDADKAWPAGPAENVWLSGSSEPQAALRRTLALGDRISIGGLGRADEFEVIGLEEINGESFGAPGLRVQVVTGRPSGAGTAEKIRFLFAVDGPEPAAAVLPGKVL